jgi:hypothetical protein
LALVSHDFILIFGGWFVYKGWWELDSESMWLWIECSEKNRKVAR